MPADVSSVLLVTPRWTRDGGVAAHVISSATALARHGVDVSVLAARIDSTEPVQGVTLFHSPELFNERASDATRLSCLHLRGPLLSPRA